MTQESSYSNLQEVIKKNLTNWRTRMTRLGTDSLYLFISAAALTPAAVAMFQGQPAGMELMGLLYGLGANLLANTIQKFRDAPDEAAVMELLQEALAQNPELEKQLNQVLASLAVLPTAQAALNEEDRAWFTQTIQAELDKRGSLPHFQAQLMAVGKGAQVIDNRGGLMISQGNRSVVHIIHQYGAPEPAQDELRPQIGRYLDWVQDKYGMIELRGIKREGQQVMQLALETIYVPLAATVYRQQAVRHNQEMVEAETPTEIAMQELLALDHRLIVTGGPGCGKTTVLLHIAWALAQALATDDPALAQERLGISGPLPLPIFIPLSAYALYMREHPRFGDPHKRTLAAFISHYLIESQAGFDLPPDFFQQLLSQGEAVILLLDGLDEVPNEAERVKVRQAIEALVTGRDNMRVVVTCRTAAYQNRTALGRGFREVKVQPLTAEHITALVEQAYSHIYQTDPTMQAKKGSQLLAGIAHLESERQRRLGKDAPRLVDSPLLVRLLLIVHYSERRRLPEQRAELYMKATDSILLPDYAPDEEVADQIGRAVGGSLEVHRDLIQHLAFHMHQKGEKQGREVSEDTLREIIAQEPLYADMVDDLVALTRVRGTLLEERMGMYRFLHLAFQEYLAARYLAEIVRGEGGVAAIADFLEDGPLLDSWWREVALLTPGYLMVTSSPTAHLLLQRLAGLDKETAMREQPADVVLAAVEIAATAFWEWGAPRSEWYDVITHKLAGLLNDTDLAHHTRPVRRAAVGVALARLGDPRPEVMDVDQMQFCYVPAGPFWMGSEESINKKKAKQHRQEMSHSYWLARFPVTNAQYAQFVENGGYAMEAYWLEAKVAGRWQDGMVKGWLGGEEPRDRPLRVAAPHNLPNHPVVGITWYEAFAFTRWLTDHWQQRGWLPDTWVVRLPTEAEWEKGARGSMQVPVKPIIKPVADLLLDPELEITFRDNFYNKAAYIWGNEPDSNRGNCNESGIGSSSAVGCFPGGMSPYGAEDMAGNVWEWTSSLFGKLDDKEQEPKHTFSYPYRRTDGREESSKDDTWTRILRGGSYTDEPNRMHFAYRGWRQPYDDQLEFGFRVCVSPVSPPTLSPSTPAVPSTRSR